MPAHTAYTGLCHPSATPKRGSGKIDEGGRWITVMAFLRKRASGNYALSFKWKGKSYIKALGTDDEQAANEVKQDADEQLARKRETVESIPFEF